MPINALTDLHDNHPCRLPLWKDRHLQGKSIQVCDERHFGDTIMLSRYLVTLKAHGAHVIFNVRPELFNLFRHWVLVDEVAKQDKTIQTRSSRHDCIPLAALPERFRTRSETMLPDTIPPDTIPIDSPYIFADPVKTDYWSNKISGKGLQVGLILEDPGPDPSNHFNPDPLGLLFDIEGLQWYCMQIGSGPSDQTGFNARPPVPQCREFSDFSDIAAAIANLDLLITFDIAVAHLAGAMGRPVWAMLPFAAGRRSFAESRLTSWYPSMALYHQSAPRDWKGPLLEVAHDLKALKAERRHLLPNEMANQRYQEAMSFHKDGLFERAEATYHDLLSLVADHHSSLSALGLLYLKTERYTAAVHTLRKAIELNPGDPLCLNNLGLAYQRLGQMESALSLYAGAIACKPDHITAYHNLGNVFLDLNNLDAVVDCYSKALEIDPGNAAAQLEMGKLYLKQLDTSNARKHFEYSVALEPKGVPARISLATTALMQGDFAVGWDQYRWRFKDRSMAGTTYPAHFNIPQWQGASFKDQRLIVHCEQGFGDTIQFSRFLPRVKGLGGKIVFQVQETLMPIFRDFPGVDELQRLPSRQPETTEADFYCPLMNIPHWLEISIDTLGTRVPYLFAQPEKVAQWRRRIPPGRFSVGVVWEGNPNHTNDHNRSCPLNHLLDLRPVNGIHWYSLQKQVSETDKCVLARESDFTLLDGDLKDFGDTAAAIACLDLVISVDTAVAHLAGAMGKPVWLMLPYLPDWRWMLGQRGTPWYPTMRLYRQPSENGWDPLIRSVKHDLKVQAQWT